MKLTKRNRKYLRKISPVQILTSTQSLPSQPIAVRPPPPPVTPPQTPRPVPAQPLAPATAPPVPRPPLPDNTPTVPPLVIRRSPGLYTKSHHSRHLSITPGCPGLSLPSHLQHQQVQHTTSYQHPRLGLQPSAASSPRSPGCSSNPVESIPVSGSLSPALLSVGDNHRAEYAEDESVATNITIINESGRVSPQYVG